jgi:hypothetical protein
MDEDENEGDMGEEDDGDDDMLNSTERGRLIKRDACTGVVQVDRGGRNNDADNLAAPTAEANARVCVSDSTSMEMAGFCQNAWESCMESSWTVAEEEQESSWCALLLARIRRGREGRGEKG